MASPAVTVEVLPAAYGDSILVTCSGQSRPWRMLVDTGPDECWPTLSARLAQIKPDRFGKRRVDLAVISHVDHDHIGCAKALFSDKTLGLSFGDVWFNAPVMPASKSVAEGQNLADLLGASPGALPWNRAWQGRHAVTPADALFAELPAAPGKPKITLLSPSPASLAAMFKVWKAELARPPVKEGLPFPPAASREVVDLEALARKKTAVDRSAPNGSSIAFLLEHKGRSVLLAADAHPTVLIPALTALAAHRKAALPLQFDAFKLSHHGSRANVTVDLMRAAQARHYVFSTNGTIFGHPDDEGVARAIVEGGAGRELWFNYRNGRTEKWASQELQQRYGYSVHLPAESGSCSIALA
jgi:beta-lactamase superfamily II metal-dependent hydrolase